MPKRKFYPASELPARLQRLRARGKRLVFTNGCFDLLHPGHIRTLNAAKAEGAVLVVAVNADASVRKLKGPGRPVFSERERVAVLSALEVVDFVTVFEEETPLALIRLLKPDVLVKGGDWSARRVVGRAVVERGGGKVVLVPYEAGFSTTAIIERIRALG